MRAGDFITAVSYNDVKWGCHNKVISLIRAAGDNLTLHLVTPLDCNYLQPPAPGSPQVVTCMQSGTLNKGDTRVHRKSWTGGSWKLRKRRSKSREGKADRNIVANGKHWQRGHLDLCDAWLWLSAWSFSRFEMCSIFIHHGSGKWTIWRKYSWLQLHHFITII